MNDKNRLFIGIGLIIVSILIFFISLSSLTSCTAEPVKEETYTLTSVEKGLVELAFNNRHIWETTNHVSSSYSKNASSIALREKNGHYFLEVMYKSNNYNSSQPFQVLGTTKKYTLNISKRSVYLQRSDEWGAGADTGLVYGTWVDYDTSDSNDKKKENIAKAISGRAGVITFKNGEIIFNE